MRPLRSWLIVVLLGAAFSHVPAQEPPAEVRSLAPTIPGGREWHAAWQTAREVPPYTPDAAQPEMRNEDGILKVAQGEATIAPGQTRLVVGSPQGSHAWQNVEMTIYVKVAARSRTLDYQALYLSARSGLHHRDSDPCEGTSYHATLRFDGTAGFKKELWHTGGYTELRPQPAPKLWPTIPEGQWIGLKFLCRNCDGGQHVRLELHLDRAAKNEWELVAEYTDAGDWRGKQPGCDRPQDAILTEARPAAYFRTDYVAAQLARFSIREVEPLP